jgi:ligand-binding SRPBCC domain-containing protein
MATFTKSSVIEAPVSVVFGFHEREDALQLLTPKFPPAHLISKTGIGIAPGTRVVLRVGFTTWVALHTDYQRNRLFVDEQISGPFARWIHRHEFEDLQGTRTRLTDRIEFELPGGRLATAALGWAVSLALTRMFDQRHRVTRQYCESSSLGGG